jgi:NAD(P)-dependent dehydrogenase (short-subunit alcohol dehydrogenase family)
MSQPILDRASRFSLRGKRARVTGASRGIGAEIAPVKARIPLHRFGMPLEIADLVLFLAAPASDFICGQVVFIDGGYSAV